MSPKIHDICRRYPFCGKDRDRRRHHSLSTGGSIRNCSHRQNDTRVTGLHLLYTSLFIYHIDGVFERPKIFLELIFMSA
jgi:hypothetical protein